ncbi:hypothetical protein SARC_14897 [Sphaeroforma arctica JP610]|uniref:Uncharacterized protein n=1 Tax=Sphaeroforma arctica JP610 TaxID=667725 RepID=A0A0L0F7J0_9EUKA|nr:hypothetical protein SARC_14897 [Sphaeroforma arctica JP610]KNC72546.1 hypothetical protein SARC_14897 [Sphaeroforma arctica JP610]|eukprot:XP_014146448.1 hypothetical protein SARC_14897 [Sphaeroforma arctica JP610]
MQYLIEQGLSVAETEWVAENMNVLLEVQAVFGWPTSHPAGLPMSITDLLHDPHYDMHCVTPHTDYFARFVALATRTAYTKLAYDLHQKYAHVQRVTEKQRVRFALFLQKYGGREFLARVRRLSSYPLTTSNTPLFSAFVLSCSVVYGLSQGMDVYETELAIQEMLGWEADSEADSEDTDSDADGYME